uniref:Putative ovule protein n=1 Tax=Solanum chacoense TaxID=4108 RepID=A0A0V0GN17_SOLCH
MQKGGRKCNITGDCCSSMGLVWTTYEYCSLDIVRCNVQVHTQRDDVDGKLMVNHVLLLLDSVVVTLVGVGPHQIIVLLNTVKANATLLVL